MSEREQRTEQATPRRRERLKEEGKVARSADVGSAAVLVAACGAIAVCGHDVAAALSQLALQSLSLSGSGRPTEALQAAVVALAPLALPLVMMSVAGGVAGVAQARVFSLSLLAFDPQRLDPLPALARMLPGREMLVEIGKQLAKLTAIGGLAYALIREAMPMFSALAATAPTLAFASVAEVAARLTVRIGVVFAALAALDYWLAHRKFLEDAKMSRQEVRDEHKEEEGRPEVRERIRRRMRDLLKKRAASDMKQATVLVTNPTHFAVALRYVPGKDAAPIVLAKGTEAQALSLRAAARKHRVPIVEHRPLARSLYKTGKVGQPIPLELYRAAAEVIAYVLSLRAPTRGQVARGEPA